MNKIYIKSIELECMKARVSEIFHRIKFSFVLSCPACPQSAPNPIKESKLNRLTLETKMNKWLTIEVLKDEDFTRGSEPKLRELLYHELFHCYMNKGHLPEDIQGIMNPYLNPNNRRAEKGIEDKISEEMRIDEKRREGKIREEKIK